MELRFRISINCDFIFDQILLNEKPRQVYMKNRKLTK